MPQVYTVATKNAFAALDDNSDGETILPQAPEKKAEEQPQQQSPSAEATQRRPNARGPNANPTNRVPSRRSGGAGSGTAVEEADSTGRPRRSGRPRPQPQPYTPWEAKPKPTEVRLDRHSGTGRGKELKKEGGGAYNWGNQIEDFGAEDQVAREVEPPNASDKEVDTAEKQPPQQQQATQPTSVLYAEYAQKRAEEAAFQPKEVTKSASKVEAGYQLYTKEVKNQSTREHQQQQPEKERKKNTVSVPLRYQGNRQPSGEGKQNQRRRQDEKQDQRSSSADAENHSIDLQDKLAFPTLEAH